MCAASEDFILGNEIYQFEGSKTFWGFLRKKKKAAGQVAVSDTIFNKQFDATLL